jgi:hypothetical protein
MVNTLPGVDNGHSRAEPIPGEDDIIALVRASVEEAVDLPSYIRRTGLPKIQVYENIRKLAYEGSLAKADIFFAFGAIGNEIDFFFERVWRATGGV